MALKRIGDLTASAGLTLADLLEIETAAGLSRKATINDIKAALAAAGVGAAWDFDPPLAADFPTYIGAAGATLTDNADVGLMFDGGTPVSGDSNRALVKAVPAAADWTVTAKFDDACISNPQYGGMGLVVANAAATKFTMLRMDVRTSVSMYRGNLPAGYGGAELQSSAFAPFVGSAWFRFGYVHATGILTLSFSFDGKRWHVLTTETVSAFLGNVAYVGIGSNTSRTAGPNLTANVKYWEQSW